MAFNELNEGSTSTIERLQEENLKNDLEEIGNLAESNFNYFHNNDDPFDR